MDACQSVTPTRTMEVRNRMRKSIQCAIHSKHWSVHVKAVLPLVARRRSGSYEAPALPVGQSVALHFCQAHPDLPFLEAESQAGGGPRASPLSYILLEGVVVLPYAAILGVFKHRYASLKMACQ